MSTYGSLPEGWNEVELMSLSSVITDGAHSSPKPQTQGRFMCSVKDMTYNKFDFTNVKLISEEDYQFLVKQGCAPQKGDLLISKDGANCLDLLFLYEQEEEIVLLSSIAIVRLKDTVCKEYVRYFLLSPDCQFIMRNNYVSGSAIPRVVLKDFKKVPIVLPPLPEQKAIASVLSSLDDKIDLLHRQNKTLEAMAETLFRQWFIEDETIAEVVVSELIEFNPKRSLSKGTDAIYLEMAGLSTQSFNATGYYRREFSSGTKFIQQDTLLARITPCLENGKAGYVTFLRDNEVGWGSTEYIVMRPKAGLHPLMAYVLCRNQEFKDYAESCMEGSSGRQRVNVDHLKDFTIGKPSDEVIQQFNNYLESIESKLIYNSKQIQTLENLRDTLLPKLMSGEVRVQYQIEEVA
ncbi:MULTISPECIES: restriction endonuclease subunit S [unclassified Acinetobacter]|uniref:restriction endonuclease subunit S n=1 Tax=unclassified Acinetobacter TaxID=196816 RepID=UPI00211F2CA0|nr:MULTISPECIES: restriction endonuclease subunit S [unclassified Acinetobacter]